MLVRELLVARFILYLRTAIALGGRPSSPVGNPKLAGIHWLMNNYCNASSIVVLSSAPTMKGSSEIKRL